MRLFIAIDIPEKIKDEIEEDFKYAKDKIKHARFTQRDKLHLTLAFVGEQDDKAKEILKEIVRDASLRFRNEEVFINRAMIGPSPDFPRMIWAMLDTKSFDYLSTISSYVREKLNEAKIKFDPKHFNGHITLARFDVGWQDKVIKFGHQKEIKKEIDNINKSFLNVGYKFNVDSICLFESVLSGHEHVYSKLFESNFKL